jgi:ubiquinol-cytochrome c reductase cytochrome c1 subunit
MMGKASIVRVPVPTLARKRITACAASLAVSAAITLGAATVANAAEDHLPPKDVSFSFEGPFGTFDRAALQRGFQVYDQVCSACHSMNLLSYRNLGEEGGPDFSKAQVKAIAASKQVAGEPDDDGNPTQRPGKPSDTFVAPFPNEQAARAANGGALPPDQSLMAKAHEGGAKFIYSILTGYQDPPPDFKLQEGLHYNPYFPGKQIAMPQPLSDDSVSYTDGTKATLEQEAHDVATFLAWAAEPKMEARKNAGFDVIIYLLILSGLLYLTYRKVWAEHH